MPDDGDQSDEEPEAGDLFDGTEDADSDIGPSGSEDAEPEEEHPEGANPVWWFALQQLSDIREFVESYLQERRETKERQFRHRENIIKYTGGSVLGVIIIAAYMTVNGALSGDAFTFVLGTLFGSLLTFLQNMLQQAEEY